MNVLVIVTWLVYVSAQCDPVNFPETGRGRKPGREERNIVLFCPDFPGSSVKCYVCSWVECNNENYTTCEGKYGCAKIERWSNKPTASGVFFFPAG